MTTEQSDAVDAIRAQREAYRKPLANVYGARIPEADPTLGPDGTEAVDLDPTGCPYTWTPGADTPLGRVFNRVRCTRPVHDDDRHHWDSREQQERDDRVRAALIEGMKPALTKPLAKTPITITGLKPGTDYTVRNVSVDGAEPVTITTPSTDHLPNAINRLRAYIDARTGPGHAARALRDENTHTILLDDLGAVLEAASRAIATPPLSPTSAFIAALEQDRVDWYADHRSEPGIAENAFERGWDARRAYDRAATQRIRDALDNLHANDGMPHSQRAALYDLVSALDA